jgi:hypothetical protein
MGRGRSGLFLAAAVATWLAVLPAATAQAAAPARYATYYSIFHVGERTIPYTGTNYVPQGLTYWPEKDAMVVSYYDDNHGKARIAILDRKTSTLKKSLFLDDNGHVGALATSAHYIWVSNSGRVIRYAKSTLDGAAPNSQVKSSNSYPVTASSFLEIYGNTMYVGQFNQNAQGKAYRYALDAAEVPKYDNHSFDIPSRVQGMAITDKDFVWSRSFGRNNDSQLVVDSRNGPVSRRVTAPNMSEDLAIADGELYVVYESSAKKYSDADYIIRSIHHGKLSALIH